MKPKYNNKYRQKYACLMTYSSKQIRTRVKKNFMHPDEFLGIYNLYINAKTYDDAVFIIELIETSKTYRHYKKCKIMYHGLGDKREICDKVQDSIYIIKHRLDVSNNPNLFKTLCLSIMEWLFAHTIHTSSLNSVTFK